jgi:hypothetical protein
MRSFILPAAIAAAFVVIPTASGFAAANRHEHPGRAGADKYVSVGGPAEEGDPVPPVVKYPSAAQWPMAAPLHRDGRLAVVESELGRAMHEINAGRRLGELTPSEAGFVRREDGAVRAEAMRVARANGGRIPLVEYAMLQQRVGDLDRVIHRYETGALRG